MWSSGDSSEKRFCFFRLKIHLTYICIVLYYVKINLSSNMFLMSGFGCAVYENGDIKLHAKLWYIYSTVS